MFLKITKAILLLWVFYSSYAAAAIYPDCGDEQYECIISDLYYIFGSPYGGHVGPPESTLEYEDPLEICEIYLTFLLTIADERASLSDP